jgi:hypothetical protein
MPLAARLPCRQTGWPGRGIDKGGTGTSAISSTRMCAAAVHRHAADDDAGRAATDSHCIEARGSHPVAKVALVVEEQGDEVVLVAWRRHPLCDFLHMQLAACHASPPPPDAHCNSISVRVTGSAQLCCCDCGPTCSAESRERCSPTGMDERLGSQPIVSVSLHHDNHHLHSLETANCMTITGSLAYASSRAQHLN